MNTEYFDLRGGYEYAKAFYAEAYKLAVELVGGEQYVLSAVMHADERHSALSNELKRDVYHYHLHVVYVPVVRKEVYFMKNNANPELAGKLREVIAQVSHSKKWPRLKKVDANGVPVKTKNGKAVLMNSYSLLQDQFYGHMRAMGYTDVERGERGSTAEHLSDLEYKSKQEAERAAALAAEVERKQEAAAVLDTAINSKTQTSAELDKQAETKKKQLETLNKKTAVVKEGAAMFDEINRMANNRSIGGKILLSPKDWEKVSNLAKD